MRFFVLGLVLLLTVLTFGQKKFEGVITYSIEYLEVPAEVEGMESMLPQEMIMGYSDPYIVIEQEVMGGSQVVVTNSKKNEAFILMDMMGQKIAVTITSEEIEAENENAPETSIEYVDETKKIAGYKCKKAIITQGDQQNVVWYTEKIKPVKGYGSNGNFKGLKGVPLEYESSQPGMQLLMTATDIQEKSLDKDKFVIPEGYDVMTLEELQGTLGQ